MLAPMYSIIKPWNGLMNYASRGFVSLENFLNLSLETTNAIFSDVVVFNGEASAIDPTSDVYVTDPPYGGML
jgi:hypothetical protein